MRYVLPLLFLVLLSACGQKTDLPFPLPPSEGAASSSADSSGALMGEPLKEVQQETGNVSYRGVVEPLGISLYMQGTHRLALPDGRFVLLEGPAVDLREYLGEEVEVFGAVRPTVEAGGVIMRVERVERTRQTSTVSSMTVSSAVPPPSPLSPSSSASVSSSRVSSLSSSLAAIPSSSSSSVAGAPDRDAWTGPMAEEKFTAEQWTQEYCSTHVGFCVPVHRNWWFKSFGATASSLWHVEVSGEPVQNLGDGTLLVNLIQGEIATTGAADRDVRMHGNFAVGYRHFSENRHFEISAPAELKEAVQYMTEHLK